MVYIPENDDLITSKQANSRCVIMSKDIKRLVCLQLRRDRWLYGFNANVKKVVNIDNVMLIDC